MAGRKYEGSRRDRQLTPKLRQQNEQNERSKRGLEPADLWALDGRSVLPVFKALASA